MKMRLETEYFRPSGLNQPDNLQNFIMKYVRYNIKWLYLQKLFDSILDEHRHMFVLYSTECEYQLAFTAKDKDKPLGIAAIYLPTSFEKQKKFSKNWKRWT